MDYTEFINNVKKVNTTKKHRISNSIGTMQIYEYLRKNKWPTVGHHIDRHNFQKVVRRVNEKIVDALLDGKIIKLPYCMGILEVCKTPRKMSIKNNKLVNNLPVDWNKTLELWYCDDEAYRDKTLVKLDCDWIYRVHYKVKQAHFTNKTFYQFRPMRDFKIRLAERAKIGSLEVFAYNDNKDYD